MIRTGNLVRAVSCPECICHSDIFQCLAFLVYHDLPCKGIGDLIKILKALFQQIVARYGGTCCYIVYATLQFTGIFVAALRKICYLRFILDRNGVCISSSCRNCHFKTTFALSSRTESRRRDLDGILNKLLSGFHIIQIRSSLNIQILCIYSYIPLDRTICCNAASRLFQHIRFNGYGSFVADTLIRIIIRVKCRRIVHQRCCTVIDRTTKNTLIIIGTEFYLCMIMGGNSRYLNINTAVSVFRCRCNRSTCTVCQLGIPWNLRISKSCRQIIRDHTIQ